MANGETSDEDTGLACDTVLAEVTIPDDDLVTAVFEEDDTVVTFDLPIENLSAVECLSQSKIDEIISDYVSIVVEDPDTEITVQLSDFLGDKKRKPVQGTPADVGEYNFDAENGTLSFFNEGPRLGDLLDLDVEYNVTLQIAENPYVRSIETTFQFLIE
jgi:hypothetical protein